MKLTASNKPDLTYIFRVVALLLTNRAIHFATVLAVVSIFAGAFATFAITAFLT